MLRSCAIKTTNNENHNNINENQLSEMKLEIIGSILNEILIKFPLKFFQESSKV